MNTEMNDKLDLLIAFSATDCENDDVEMFKNLDTSGVTFSEDFYVKQRRLINKYKRKPALILLRKCFVRVAVVLMAIMSIGFLTAMAIPNVRRVCTRYDKLDVIFLSFVQIACVFMWLK